LQLGVTPLSDNQAADSYFYQILVYTGHRPQSATRSKVSFVLTGSDDETGARSFSDDRRPILQRGSIDAFVMAVPK
jgi:polycystin 1L2